MHEKKIVFEDISSDMILRNKLQRQKLLSDSDIRFLQDIAVARDEVNNGVTRHEMVSIIQEITEKDRKI